MRYVSRTFAIGLLSALGSLGFVGGASATTKTAHIRGTAYEFYGNGSPSAGGTMAGAIVSVYEYPTIHAVVAADGTYDLAVPYKASKVTPYINAVGYYPISLQTFTMAGKDLAHVNFQTPTDAVSNYLMMILNATPVDPLATAWRVKDCVIVSTFNVKAVHNLSYYDFSHFGSHGIANATAKASPTLSGAAAPVYFNDQTVPDRKQKTSSVDGGVIFTHVPSGTYTLTASHKTAKFASFKATCRAGRVINASPPWGFYQTK